MPLIKSDSGCKVGWETYDNEDEARERAKTARTQAREMATRGYDFGFQVPGEVVQRRQYTTTREDGSPDATGPYDLIDEWVVTVP